MGVACGSSGTDNCWDAWLALDVLGWEQMVIDVVPDRCACGSLLVTAGSFNQGRGGSGICRAAQRKRATPHIFNIWLDINRRALSSGRVERNVTRRRGGGSQDIGLELQLVERGRVDGSIVGQRKTGSVDGMWQRSVGAQNAVGCGGRRRDVVNEWNN